MTAEEIQSRLNELATAMLGKGLVRPNACVWFDANREPRVTLQWEDMRKPAGVYRTVTEPFGDGDLTEQFGAASAFVSNLPSAEQAKLQDFMSALGNVIDLGRKSGIEVSYVNPLVETMKRLSENAITFQPAE